MNYNVIYLCIQYAGKPPSPEVRKRQLSPTASACGLFPNNPAQELDSHGGIYSSSFGANTTAVSNNLALKAFTMNFDAIHSAVTPHVDWLTKKLSANLVIPKESCDSLRLLHTPMLQPSQKAAVLLSLTQLSITADYRCLRRFVRVLKRHSPLRLISDTLRKSYSGFYN